MLTFVHYWSDFYDPLIYLQTTSKMTLPLGLSALLQLDRTNWPLLMAGSVMVTAPVILLFLAAQRALLQQQRETGWLGR
jgi:multiple sugar transport system permease protein